MSGQKSVDQRVGVHVCNDDDWAKFYNPSKLAKTRIDDLKRRSALYCLNENDKDGKPVNMDLYGPDENYPHRRIEIMYRPCDPIKETEANKHLHETECLV